MPGQRLAELLDDPGLLARHPAAMDGRAAGRMVPSLPYIDAIPAEGSLRVRLTTARAVLETDEDAVMLSAAGSTYECAPAAEAVLRSLVDGRTTDLATLAETAGPALEDVAELLQELVAGQAAAVGEIGVATAGVRSSGQGVGEAVGRRPRCPARLWRPRRAPQCAS